MGCPFPDSFSRPRAGGDAHGRRRPLQARLRRPSPPLRDFAALLGSPLPNREAALRLAGETVLERLKRGFPAVRVLEGLAPLMGLLGTILGMITTFPRIAEARSGVHMSLLAGDPAGPADHGGGAASPSPRCFSWSCFQGKVRRVADALNKAGNVALLADGGPGITVRAGGGTASARRHSRGGGTAEGPLARNRRNLAAVLRSGREAPAMPG